MSSLVLRVPALVSFLLALTLVVGCTGPVGSPDRGGTAAGTPPQRTKAITIVLTAAVESIGLLSSDQPLGGWPNLTELHSDGLITTEGQNHKPIGHLAERVPSLDDGSISILPDGRMDVVFRIRKGVTWHDGTPFTAADLVFSYDVCCRPGIPNQYTDVTRLMSSVEARDESTLVVSYKAPNLFGANLGPAAFWPVPRHILEAPYARFRADERAEAVVNLPYWTSEYVHLGPFRVAAFDPGVGLTLEAYDRYYLGRPKLDVIHVRSLADQAALMSNFLSQQIDLIPPHVIPQSNGVEFQRRWEASGDGTVHVISGSIRLVEPQTDPARTGQPALRERDVRAALLHAMDREALSEALFGVRGLAAWTLLATNEPTYTQAAGDAARDALRPFAYDPARAKTLLAGAGWTEAGGALRHSVDGRPFRLPIWGSPGTDRETALYASSWRQVGIDVEEFVIPFARNTDREFRSSFPGVTMTGSSPLTLLSESAATAPQWRGNRGGFQDPVAQRLVDTYETSLAPAAQAQAMRAINDYVIRELPFLPTVFLPNWVGIRKGVKAADAVAPEGSEVFGGWARGSHLWDLE